MAMMNPKLGDCIHDALDMIEHTSTVAVFYHSFETIQGLLLEVQPWLPEPYLATRFVYGLRPEYQLFVLRFRPVTVLAAFRLATIYEESIGASELGKQLVLGFESPDLDPNSPVITELGNFLQDRMDQLTHTTSVEALYLRFETIKSFVTDDKPWLPESYFADRFVYCLQTEYQMFVFNFHPMTVKVAYRLASMFEESIYLHYFPESESHSEDLPLGESAVRDHLTASHSCKAGIKGEELIPFVSTSSILNNGSGLVDNIAVDFRGEVVTEQQWSISAHTAVYMDTHTTLTQPSVIEDAVEDAEQVRKLSGYEGGHANDLPMLVLKEPKVHPPDEATILVNSSSYSLLIYKGVEFMFSTASYVKDSPTKMIARSGDCKLGTFNVYNDSALVHESTIVALQHELSLLFYKSLQAVNKSVSNIFFCFTRLNYYPLKHSRFRLLGILLDASLSREFVIELCGRSPLKAQVGNVVIFCQKGIEIEVHQGPSTDSPQLIAVRDVPNRREPAIIQVPYRAQYKDATLNFGCFYLHSGPSPCGAATSTSIKKGRQIHVCILYGYSQRAHQVWGYTSMTNASMIQKIGCCWMNFCLSNFLETKEALTIFFPDPDYDMSVRMVKGEASHSYFIWELGPSYLQGQSDQNTVLSYLSEFLFYGVSVAVGLRVFCWPSLQVMFGYDKHRLLESSPAIILEAGQFQFYWDPSQWTLLWKIDSLAHQQIVVFNWVTLISVPGFRVWQYAAQKFSYFGAVLCGVFIISPIFIYEVIEVQAVNSSRKHLFVFILGRDKHLHSVTKQFSTKGYKNSATTMVTSISNLICFLWTINNKGYLSAPITSLQGAGVGARNIHMPNAHIFPAIESPPFIHGTMMTFLQSASIPSKSRLEIQAAATTPSSGFSTSGSVSIHHGKAMGVGDGWFASFTAIDYSASPIGVVLAGPRFYHVDPGINYIQKRHYLWRVLHKSTVKKSVL